MPFDQWSARLAGAEDVDTRRALLTEINYWRATRLSDIPAQRDAAFALSRLHALLSNHEGAVREAQSLVSLCQSPPEASAEELKMAVGFLQTLGGKGVVGARPRPPRPERQERPERHERSERQERPERQERSERHDRGERAPRQEWSESLDRPRQPTADEAIAHARAGRYAEALRAAEGRKGPRADLFRTYVVLAKALQEDDSFRRARDLLELERNLKGLVLEEEREEARPAARRESPRTDARPERAERPERPERAERAERTDEEREPSERQQRIDRIEADIVARPADVDEIAAAALAEHLQIEGPRAPAPWLIGVVARAFVAGDAPKTKAEIAKQRVQGTYAVTAYQEAPFELMVALLGAAGQRGYTYVGLRRGILARGEPRERKLWTLRIAKDGVERLIVAGAPNPDDPYRPDTAARLARRMVELCERSLMIAPGPGSEPLRQAAVALGASAIETGTAEAILEQLEAVAPLRAPERPDRPERPERPAEARAEAAPRRDEAEEVRQLLARATAPSSDELVPLLRALSRVHRAFPVAREVLAGFPSDEADRRLATLLEAADRAAPERARLSEGTTLAIRAAATIDESTAAKLLLSGSTAQRFGGAGVDVVTRLGAAAIRGGWELDRVLRGPTGRERRADPALDALGDAAEGLWRLVVLKNGLEGEIWYVADLPPEGRAALPRLLLESRARVVVLPIESDLLAWYGTLQGPAAIGWSGPETSADVVGEMQRWG